MNTVCTWIDARNKVPCQVDSNWSDDVIVMTDNLSVMSLAYGGVWQRSRQFVDSGSKYVMYWMPMPSYPD